MAYVRRLRRKTGRRLKKDVTKKNETNDLTDYGLTFEERQQLISHNIKKLQTPLKVLDQEGLKQEIEQFLKKKQCLSLAMVSPAGFPHQSILDYQSDGIDIYIASEGGEKFQCLEISDRVSVSIGFSDGTVESEYGLTLDGVAKVYKAPHPKYISGIMKLKDFIMEWSRSIQPMENILSKAISTRLIKVTPYRMTYMNIPEGITLSRWERNEII